MFHDNAFRNGLALLMKQLWACVTPFIILSVAAILAALGWNDYQLDHSGMSFSVFIWNTLLCVMGVWIICIRLANTRMKHQIQLMKQKMGSK